MTSKIILSVFIIPFFFCLLACHLQQSTSEKNQSDAPYLFDAAGVSTNSINIKWYDHSSHESGFIVERSLDGVNFTMIKNISISNVESYIDTSLSSGIRYYYRVRAFYSEGYSPYSNVKEAKTLEIGSLIDQLDNIPGFPDHISTEIPQEFPDINDIINAPASSISIYGLFTWYNHYYTAYSNFINETKNVGWKSLRIGANNDQFYGASGDDAMKGLLSFDCDIMLTFCGTSSRNRSVFGLPLYGSGCEPGDSNFISDYTNYLDKILSRYGPNGTFFSDYPALPYRPVKYVEIWNEPNEHYLFSNPSVPGANSVAMVSKARLYAKLLMTAYKFIKDKWGNNINVVGLSACGGSKNDLSWGWDPGPDTGFIEMVHKYIQQFGGDPSQCYDILSDHPYTHITPPDAECYPLNRTGYHYSVANSLAAYKKIMADYGNGNKPIWFTEVGWRRDYGRYAASSDSVPERIQAAYVMRLYLMALRLGVKTVQVMFIFDEVSNFGFFNYSTRQWYECAYAMQNMIKIMPNPKIISAINDGTNCYYAYSFKPDAGAITYNPVIAAWNVLGRTNVVIPCNNDTYKIIDMLGNSKILTVTSGMLNIEIGPYPIFITKN